MKFLKKIKKVFSGVLAHENQYERYLSSSADIFELEHRQRMLNQRDGMWSRGIQDKHHYF